MEFNTEEDSLTFLKEKQVNYSFAFRKCYKNYHKLKDIQFINFIKDNFKMNDIEFRSVATEVKTRFKQTTTFKKDLENEIVELTKELTKLKKKTKSRKNTREIFKTNKKLQLKSSSLSNDIVFGSRKLLSEISYLNNDKVLNKEKIIEKKKEFIDNRITFQHILGEANQKGNRFFDFKILDNLIIYKPCFGVKHVLNITSITLNKKDKKNELKLLQDFIDNKLIPVYVKLSSSEIHLSYDDTILYNTAINKKDRDEEVKIIKDSHIDDSTIKKLINEVYIKYYDELKDKLLKNNEFEIY